VTTFEKYLSLLYDVDVTEYRLVATKSERGEVTFYIHPMDVGGDTPTFSVVDNTLSPVVVEVPDVAA